MASWREKALASGCSRRKARKGSAVRDPGQAAAAIIDVGKKFAESGVGGCGADAFRKVYGTGSNNHLQLVWGSTNTGSGGITLFDRGIEFASISGMTDLQKKDWKKAFVEGRKNVIHELGHGTERIHG